MKTTVLWNIFDGKGGFPNIVAELDWTTQWGRSYEDIIFDHARYKIRDKDVGMRVRHIEFVSKGKIGDRPYRDYNVTYNVKTIDLHRLGSGFKVSGIPSGNEDDNNEQITKRIRIFRERED